MSNNQNEYVKEFIIECVDLLNTVDNDLLQLENDPTNEVLLGKIFRAFHNIKGSSGFLNFHQLESLTHVGESLLSKMRDGQILLNSEIILALISMSDAVRVGLKAIEATGKEVDNDHQDLKARLTACIQNQAQTTTTKTEKVKDALDIEIEKAMQLAKEEAKNQLNSEDAAKSNIAEHIPETLGIKNNSSSQVAEPLKNNEETKSIADTSIRVDLVVLDNLMNLVGELVLIRNQILQVYDQETNLSITKSLQVLNRITSDLQTEVMKTRMQPIHTIFNKFPRIARTLADNLRKKINLEIEGKDTELDRALIDSLRDPLTHMVRNSIDHGIEMPEERLACGKSESGTIKLKAYHESGQVHIDILDDGSGIDPKKIKAKAIEKGLISIEQGEQMVEKELLNMIFLPGFSTSSVITNISGRGVGMDVVKTNIEKMGGSVEISSVVGKNTLFNLKIPLTLAIIPALIIGIDKTRIAIPQINIRELYRIEKENTEKIENIHGTPVFYLRNESIPLLYLDKELGVEKEEKSKEIEAVNIAILQIENQSVGLVVDEIYDSQEIVVKPLPIQLEGLVVYSGTTILGDGRIALILDVLRLAYRANAISNAQKMLHAPKDLVITNEIKLTKVLVCRTIDDGQLAVPLDKVVRLEAINKKDFELVGGSEIVQYRGSALLIYRALNFLQERRKKKRMVDESAKLDFLDFLDQEHVHVIVNSIKGKEVGFVVGKILDSIEVDLSNLGMSTRRGVEGTIIVNNKVIEVLNMERLILESDPHFLTNTAIGKMING